MKTNNQITKNIFVILLVLGIVFFVVGCGESTVDCTNKLGSNGIIGCYKQTDIDSYLSKLTPPTDTDKYDWSSKCKLGSGETGACLKCASDKELVNYPADATFPFRCNIPAVLAVCEGPIKDTKVVDCTCTKDGISTTFKTGNGDTGFCCGGQYSVTQCPQAPSGNCNDLETNNEKCGGECGNGQGKYNTKDKKCYRISSGCVALCTCTATQDKNCDSECGVTNKGFKGSDTKCYTSEYCDALCQSSSSLPGTPSLSTFSPSCLSLKETQGLTEGAKHLECKPNTEGATTDRKSVG
jgi:hypothetical protein